MATQELNAHIIVSGKVQGVFFRVWVKKLANKLGLTGWVRNLPAQAGTDDGKVEMLLQGEKEEIERLIEMIKDEGGPKFAKVDGVDTEWGKPKESLSGFEIRY